MNRDDGSFKRISLMLLHVLAGISVLACISTLIGALLSKEFAKANDRELGMIAVLSFRVLTLSFGIIGMVTGSIFSSTFGEMKMMKARSPFTWLLANLLSIGIGIGFLIWGCRLVWKWIGTT